MTNATYIGRSLTATELKYDRYATQTFAMVKGLREKVLVYRAFIECAPESLNLLVPADARWGLKPDGTQKTRREFTFAHTPLVNGNILMRLAAKEAPNYRTTHVTADDLADWDSYLGGSSDWLDLIERNERLPKEEV